MLMLRVEGIVMAAVMVIVQAAPNVTVPPARTCVRNVVNVHDAVTVPCGCAAGNAWPAEGLAPAATAGTTPRTRTTEMRAIRPRRRFVCDRSNTRIPRFGRIGFPVYGRITKARSRRGALSLEVPKVSSHSPRGNERTGSGADPPRSTSREGEIRPRGGLRRAPRRQSYRPA